MWPAFQFTCHAPAQIAGMLGMGDIGNVKCRVFAGRVHVIKNKAKAGFASDLIKRIRKIDLFADQIAKLVNAVGRECRKRLCIGICWVRGFGHCAICSCAAGGQRHWWVSGGLVGARLFADKAEIQTVGQIF